MFVKCTRLGVPSGTVNDLSMKQRQLEPGRLLLKAERQGSTTRRALRRVRTDAVRVLDLKCPVRDGSCPSPISLLGLLGTRTIRVTTIASSSPLHSHHMKMLSAIAIGTQLACSP